MAKRQLTDDQRERRNAYQREYRRKNWARVREIEKQSKLRWAMRQVEAATADKGGELA